MEGTVVEEKTSNTMLYLIGGLVVAILAFGTFLLFSSDLFSGLSGGGSKVVEVVDLKVKCVEDLRLSHASNSGNITMSLYDRNDLMGPTGEFGEIFEELDLQLIDISALEADNRVIVRVKDGVDIYEKVCELRKDTRISEVVFKNV